MLVPGTKVDVLPFFFFSKKLKETGVVGRRMGVVNHLGTGAGEKKQTQTGTAITQGGAHLSDLFSMSTMGLPGMVAVFQLLI